MALLGGGIISIWRKRIISVVVLLLNLALWVIIIRAIAQVGGIWDDSVTHLLLAAYVSCLTVIWAGLATLGLLRVHRASSAAARHGASSVFVALCSQDCVYYFIPTFPCMPATVVSILAFSVPLMYLSAYIFPQNRWYKRDLSALLRRQ
ncbi:hypothetical protein OE88DRAFT_1659766 [Heliocybe sulcata]|uniref:Uncharacterized protein n=1 Tax=Heliocybe sulcata TaxID=5364 RepID=A0A5C3N0P4_9AGAM|nr:hypothetical protein OE88DRAFT_1659766 [Heliocybe sulcata]